MKAIKTIVFLIFFLLNAITFVSANTYYIDAQNGNDMTGIGSISGPWKSIEKGLSEAYGGDTLILKDGHYGEFVYSTIPTPSRTNWITIKAQNKYAAQISNIRLKYPDSAYLCFDGLYIKPDWVDPDGGRPGADDPQYPESTGSTYAKAHNPIYLENISNFKAINCKLEGTNKYLIDYGLSTKNTTNVTLENSIITRTHTPILIQDSVNTMIRGNVLTDMTASAIVINYNCFDTSIIRNNCYNSNWSTADDYSPKADGAGYHGSAIAFRSGNAIIKQNIFHDGWPSSGMMFYGGQSVGGFKNVIIENNLMYDIHNFYLFRLHDVADNIIIRNNTFIGKERDTTNGKYRFFSGIVIHSLQDGYDGSGVSIYNNIVLGTCIIGNLPLNVSEGNNIMWSLMEEGFHFYDENDYTTTSKIITKTNDIPDIFYSNFFQGAVDFSDGHGKTIDFHLSSDSLGINFGDANNQPAESLGSIDSNGFILDNGALRNVVQKNAGCYETISDHDQIPSGPSPPSGLRIIRIEH